MCDDEEPTDPVEAIEWTWAGAYEAWTDDGWWFARWKAGGPVLSAPSASKLRTKIREDYDKRRQGPTDLGSR